eukprot:10492709-Alexandrium_andersonii.AAC.1
MALVRSGSDDPWKRCKATPPVSRLRVRPAEYVRPWRRPSERMSSAGARLQRSGWTWALRQVP